MLDQNTEPNVPTVDSLQTQLTKAQARVEALTRELAGVQSELDQRDQEIGRLVAERETVDQAAARKLAAMGECAVPIAPVAGDATSSVAAGASSAFPEAQLLGDSPEALLAQMNRLDGARRTEFWRKHKDAMLKGLK